MQQYHSRSNGDSISKGVSCVSLVKNVYSMFFIQYTKAYNEILTIPEETLSYI